MYCVVMSGRMVGNKVHRLNSSAHYQAILEVLREHICYSSQWYKGLPNVIGSHCQAGSGIQLVG